MCHECVRVFVNKHKLKVSTFNMQSEFTALQDAIHALTNLKQEFEQIKIFRLYKYTIKMT